MELIAFLSGRDEKIASIIKDTLKKHVVCPLKTLDEAEELRGSVPVSLFIIDSASYSAPSLGDFLLKLEDDSAVLLTSIKTNKDDRKQEPKSVFDFIDAEKIGSELFTMVERALNLRRLKMEGELLRRAGDINVTKEAPFYAKPVKEQVAAGRLHDKVLTSFAKMLAVSFDMQKLFTHFMDSVNEIVRVNKMSIMLKEGGVYYVKTHYGLDINIAENLKLINESALVSWLSKNGRIARKPARPSDAMSVNIYREMELFQSSLAFPIMHDGKLTGIFNIDHKITDEPFYEDELEIIYVLCNYLASAVKGIELYNQTWRQKDFTDNMLSSMSSGVIAIDKDEKITIFNQHASSILGMDSSDMFGGDLRRLPPPFAEILHETVVTGRSYKRYKTEILASKLPVGINSFRLLDEHGSPVGAGIVFTDLSDSRRLEEQMMMTEKLQAVNNLMAKIAHEVRNPLTSIQIYAQLINEKYGDDDELRGFYTSSVSQSIKRLDGLIDKLVTFSITQNYMFNKEDAEVLIDSAAAYILKNIPSRYKFEKGGIESPLFIEADRKFFVKALYYIVLSIIEKVPEGTAITADLRSASGSAEISLRYDGVELTDAEKEAMLKPLTEIDNLNAELNLPISRKIIEAHNGSLEIRSEKGSNIFIIRLPLMEERAVITIDRRDING
jgi:nitrogen-specific signal transduction histidine kinase